MNHQPVVTVIMAAYNAEATIGRMVESVIAQSFKDWELVIVDDGSTDGTAAIADGFAESDARIRVIHQKNCGVAVARQTGLDNARGKYTIHADADDWVEIDMLEQLVPTAESQDADIVICDYYVDAPGKKSKLIQQHPESLASADVLRGLYVGELFGGLWNKLIKKSVYDSGNIRFVPGINYCEDLLVLTKILTSAAPKVAYHEGAYYHYITNSDSLTQSVSLKGLESMRQFHHEADKILPKDESYCQIRENFKKNEFIVFFMNRLYKDSKELRSEYLRIKPLTVGGYGPRWRIGFKLIEWRLPKLAHKFIRF